MSKRTKFVQNGPIVTVTYDYGDGDRQRVFMYNDGHVYEMPHKIRLSAGLRKDGGYPLKVDKVSDLCQCIIREWYAR